MDFDARLKDIVTRYRTLMERRNQVDPDWYNGVYERYRDPILTRHHVPPHWRFDFDRERNPLLQERLGINAIMNTGAFKLDGTYYLITRTEGLDRKSFFALVASPNGIDQWRFIEPIAIDQVDPWDTNVYDMRLTRHEDGWIYGTFCTERKDPDAPESDTSAAVAQCGIVRTKDLRSWERLPDLRTESPQQRNVVLHPEFIDGKYAWYTRPQDGFISTGSGGGIGFGLSESVENAYIPEERIVDPRVYHTIKEVKNGGGAVPIKSEAGWIHVVHGVRGCAAGLRYVLYVIMTDIEEPWRVIHAPGGHFIAPYGQERVGDVSNVVFTNGAIVDDDGSVKIYYASCDTRLHVATTSVERLVDYCRHTPEDPLYSHLCVGQRRELIADNEKIMDELGVAY